MNLYILYTLASAIAGTVIDCNAISNADVRKAVCGDAVVPAATVAQQPLPSTPVATKKRASSSPIQSVSKPANQVKPASCSCPVSEQSHQKPRRKLTAQEKVQMRSLRAVFFHKAWPFTADSWNEESPMMFYHMLLDMFSRQRSPAAKNYFISLYIKHQLASDKNPIQKMMVDEFKRIKEIIGDDQFFHLFGLSKISPESIPEEFFQRIVSGSLQADELYMLTEESRGVFAKKMMPEVGLIDAAKEKAFLNSLGFSDATRRTEATAALRFYSILMGFFTKDLTYDQASKLILGSRPMAKPQVEITVPSSQASTTQSQTATSNTAAQTTQSNNSAAQTTTTQTGSVPAMPHATATATAEHPIQQSTLQEVPKQAIPPAAPLQVPASTITQEAPQHQQQVLTAEKIALQKLAQLEKEAEALKFAVKERDAKIVKLQTVISQVHGHLANAASA